MMNNVLPSCAIPLLLKPTSFLNSLTLITLLCLAGCGSDSYYEQEASTEEPIMATDKVINFKAVVGDEPYICGQTYAGIGTSASDFTFKDFRVYISDIDVTLSDGSTQALSVLEDGIWQHDGVTLLDFGHGCDGTSDNPVNTKIEGSLQLTQSQSIRQVCFDVGVPFNINHENNTLQASPLNVSGMYWAWQSGHKFFRLDGSTHAGGFNVHLGSTGCDTTNKTEAPTAECINPNRPRVCLDIDPSTQTILVDAKALLQDSNVSLNTPKTAPGCMSGNNDPECQNIIPKFGLDFMYMPSVDDKTLIEAQAQSVFYVQ